MVRDISQEGWAAVVRCGGHPLEGLWGLVVLADIYSDGAFQFSDRTKCAASNAFAGDLSEPAFYLVQPGSARGREVHLIAGVIGEPLFDVRVLVGSVVVKDQVHGQARIGFRIHLVQEADELLVPVPGLAVANNLAHCNVQSGEKCGGAVPLVVVSLAFRNTWAERQNRLRAVQRLNLALFRPR